MHIPTPALSLESPVPLVFAALRPAARFGLLFVCLSSAGSLLAWVPLALFLGALGLSVRRFPMPKAAEDVGLLALAGWLCLAWVIPGAALAAFVGEGPRGIAFVVSLALAWPVATHKSATRKPPTLAAGLSAGAVAALLPLVVYAEPPEPASQPATQPATAPTSAPSPQSAPVSAPATQPARPKNPSPRLQVSGFVDLFASFNPNLPPDQANFIPGTGSTAKRANEAGLNLAALILSREATPLGFTLALGVGQSSEVVHAGEPEGVAAGLDATRFLLQSSVVAQVTPKLALEAGVFPSHIGFEVLYSKDNWNYSRPWIGELSPYYAAGVKASYALTERLSAQLHLLNGWQLIGDNNQAKAVGTQLAYRAEALSVWFNTFLGPELPGDNRSLRGLADVVLLARLSPRAQLALSLDAAFQQRPGLDTAPWYAAAAWLRLEPRETLALSMRAEVFVDEQGAISGSPQTLAGATVTAELRPWEALILKLEGRFDQSTANSFSGPTLDAAGSVIGVQRQALALLGAVVLF